MMHKYISMADLENKQLSANNSLQKRKFEEIEKDKSEFQNIFSPKFPKVSDSSCLKEGNHWELYRSINPYTIKSYTSLLPLKSSIPNLMDGSEFSHQINSNQSNPLSSLYSSKFCSSVHSKLSSVFSLQKCFNSETVEETCNIYSEQNLNNSLFDSNSKYAPKENKLINKCKKMTDATNHSSESISSSQLHHKENLSPESLSFSKSTSAVSPLKYIDQGKVNATPIDEFTTAAGKSINVSRSAMLAAQKLIQSVFQDETGKVDTKSTNENHELCVSYDADSASFSMATGKTVDFSEPAMKTTHKFIQDGFEKEGQMMSLTSGSCNTRKEKHAFKDIGCPPTKLIIENSDDTIDKDLLKNFFEDENFFEDAALDENESQVITESGKDQDFNKALEGKTNNDLTTRKIRKSLGGRRSMRFYT